MPENVRNLLLGSGIAVGMSSPGFAGPTKFEQFESCKAAQEAVREAGSNGLATVKPFYAVIYDDP